LRERGGEEGGQRAKVRAMFSSYLTNSHNPAPQIPRVLTEEELKNMPPPPEPTVFTSSFHEEDEKDETGEEPTRDEPTTREEPTTEEPTRERSESEWKKIFDPNQQMDYYENRSSGQSQWEVPDGYHG